MQMRAERQGCKSPSGLVRVMVAVLSRQYCRHGLEATLKQHGPCSGVQQSALDRLYALAHTFVAREVSPCTKSSWDEDLRARAAHYDGDLDFCLAQPLTLEQIAAALPPDEVGRVNFTKGRVYRQRAGGHHGPGASAPARAGGGGAPATCEAAFR